MVDIAWMYEVDGGVEYLRNQSAMNAGNIAAADRLKRLSEQTAPKANAAITEITLLLANPLFQASNPEE